jgi:hypothetical protein
MDVKEAISKHVPVDALIVLGCGVDGNRELLANFVRRSQAAADIAVSLHPRIMVFSSGHPWPQTEAVETPPDSEAIAMYRLADGYAAEQYGNPLPPDIGIFTEEESTSTAAHFAKSSDLLDLQPGESLGFLTDNLHNLYSRAEYLAHLVFPKNKIRPLTHKIIFTQNEKDHERRVYYVTRSFMFGVRPGNLTAIMKRHKRMARSNVRPKNSSE